MKQVADVNVNYCDECGKEFSLHSERIKKTSVEIKGDKLLLTYLVCPFCDKVYKILLVDEAKHQKLLNDYMSIRKSIWQQQGKHNQRLLKKLVKMASTKWKHLTTYVDDVSKKYPGSFELATENNQQHIVYREKMRN